MLGLINSDCGNIRSVQNALERMGVAYVLTDQVEVLNTCEKIIFPGVGSASSVMQMLEAKGLVTWIRQCRKPFLGICLGMQLLFESSEEGDTECLGIIPGRVQRFKAGKKVPHMGWNRVIMKNEKLKIKNEGNPFYYFVHSYFVPVGVYTVGVTRYGDEDFSSVVRKEDFWGMQFHPEKSGEAGERLLTYFLQYG